MPTSHPILKGYFKHWLTYQTGTNDQNHYASGNFISYTGDVTGGFNPGWKDDVKNHRGASTALLGQNFVWSGSTRGAARTTFYHASNPTLKLGERIHGDLMSPDDFGTINTPGNLPMKARVYNAALGKFYQAAWNARRSFQGGQFLGEIGETLRMIKNPAKAFRRGLDDYSAEVRRRIKRSNNGRLPASRESTNRANRVASDTWLEFMFGWKPLLSDISSGNAALERLAREPHEYKKVNAYAEEVYSVVPSAPLYTRNIGTFTQYRFSIRRKSGYSCIIIGEVKCTISNPITMGQEVLGLSSADFVPTVWELIPYSFLVDYFSNIGDVIQAWSFPTGALAWHNRTMREFAEREVMCWCHGAFNPAPGQWIIDHNEGSSLYAKQLKTTVERDVGPLGFPSITFEIPGSSTKWLNIAALANMRRAV